MTKTKHPLAMEGGAHALLIVAAISKMTKAEARAKLKEGGWGKFTTKVLRDRVKGKL